MFGIDDPTAVAVLPTPEAAGTVGFWTEGNPGAGQLATRMRASFFNGLQQELLNILTAAGIAPSKTTYSQILTALQSNGLLYAVDTGAANACAIAYTPAITALVDGMVLWFKAKVANTGAATLNVNGLGATPVVGGAHSALQGGEIIANGKCQVVYNATLSSFVLIECTGAPLQVGLATNSLHALQKGQFQLIPVSNSLTGTGITTSISFTPSANGKVVLCCNGGCASGNITSASVSGSGYSVVGGSNNYGNSSSVCIFNQELSVTGGTLATINLNMTTSVSATLSLGGVAIFYGGY